MKCGELSYNIKNRVSVCNFIKIIKSVKNYIFMYEKCKRIQKVDIFFYIRCELLLYYRKIKFLLDFSKAL